MLNQKSLSKVAKPNSRVVGGPTVKYWKDRLELVWFKILAATVYRRVLLLERTLDRRMPMISPRMDVTIDSLDDTQMAEYFQLQPKGQESLIHDRFNHGHTCFAARYERRLIAVAWATSHRINMSPYVSLVMPLPENSIYFYESFTEPGFRGLSIQVALCAHMMRYFGAKGFQRAVTGVVPENEPSRRVYERCGFQPYGMIRFVMVGPYRRLLPATFSVHEQ
jgi:ribosomal protein S18 acetylase RimI-like enzyme